MKNITRQTHNLDVNGEKIGRISSKIAQLLMGKNKTSYVRNHDHGDVVYVENVKFLDIDKKKLKMKKYFHYSGYPGGMKTKTLEQVFNTDPADVLKRAVLSMLPNNTLRKDRIKRLIIK